MKALKVLWSLIFDDIRLVSGLVLSLLVAAMLCYIHQSTVAAVVIWLGLVLSLWISVEHERRVHSRKAQ